MKKIILLVISYMFLFSCDDREVETESNFGFAIKSDLSKSIDIKENSKLELEILPSKLVEDVEYFISYTVLEGDSVLKNEKMESLAPDTILEIESLDSLKTSYYVFSDQEGDSSMTINYSDNYGGSYTETLEFNVNKSDLDVSLIPSEEEIYLGDKLNLSFSFYQNEKQDIDYSLKYLLVEGVGLIRNYSDDEIFVGNNLIKIVEGEYNYTFKPTKSGETVIAYIIVDEFGKEYSIETSFLVKSATFEMVLFPTYGEANLTLDIGEDLVLDLNVTPIGNPEGYIDYEDAPGLSEGYIDYLNEGNNSEITYTYIINNNIEGNITHQEPSSTANTVVSNNISYDLGVLDSVLLLENNEFTFSPSDSGFGTFEIEVKASNGVTKTEFVNYRVK